MYHNKRVDLAYPEEQGRLNPPPEHNRGADARYAGHPHLLHKVPVVDARPAPTPAAPNLLHLARLLRPHHNVLDRPHKNPNPPPKIPPPHPPPPLIPNPHAANPFRQIRHETVNDPPRRHKVLPAAPQRPSPETPRSRHRKHCGDIAESV